MLLVFVLLSIVVIACGDIQVRIPETLVTPTVAGVLVRTTTLDDHRRAHLLANGLRVEIDDATTRMIEGSGDLETGDLLLTDAQGSWLMWLNPNDNEDAPAGCFELVGNAREDGAFISFETGLRLPKSADFEQGVGGREGLFRVPQSSFCVDEAGALTSYR